MKKILCISLLLVATLIAIVLVVSAGINLYDVCGSFMKALLHIAEPYYRINILADSLFILGLSVLIIGVCFGYFAASRTILRKMWTA